MSQLERPIQDALFGNVGSILSFVVGNQDAFLLSKEFGQTKFPRRFGQIRPLPNYLQTQHRFRDQSTFLCHHPASSGLQKSTA